MEFFCLRIVLSVFISSRHVITILQTVPGGVILYFCSLNYLYCMHHRLTPILHTHTHMLTAH